MDKEVAELRDQVFNAYALIVKLAKASQIILDRLGSLERTVGVLEAEATLRKAQGK